MKNDRDRISNGSYLFRLNEELSGQAELTPYFVTSGIEIEQGTISQSIHGDEVRLSQGDQDNPDQ